MLEPSPLGGLRLPPKPKLPGEHHNKDYTQLRSQKELAMSIPASNYTQVPNIVLDSIAELSNAEFKVIMTICRKTLGWQREKERLSISYLMELTGLSNQGVIRATKTLMERGWIDREAVKVKRGYSHEYYLLLDPEDSEREPVTSGHTCDIRSHVTSSHSMTSSHGSPENAVTSGHTCEADAVTSGHRSKETPLSFKETPLEKETLTPLTPQRGNPSEPDEPSSQEEEASTEILVTPDREQSDAVAQQGGSEKDKCSGVASQRQNRKTRRRTADDINRDLRTREPGKFAAWWQWYRDKICTPYGANHGDRAAAADEWIKLVDAGTDLQRISAGSAEYLRQLRAQPDPVGIPHGSNFLKGSKQHPTPYWESALRDSELETALDESFMPDDGERVTSMTRKPSRYGIDVAATTERLRRKYGQKEVANA
ncbi:MAG: replication protein [Cyanobacteria bacterium J06636_16]